MVKKQGGCKTKPTHDKVGSSSCTSSPSKNEFNIEGVLQPSRGFGLSEGSPQSVSSWCWLLFQYRKMLTLSEDRNWTNFKLHRYVLLLIRASLFLMPKGIFDDFIKPNLRENIFFCYVLLLFWSLWTAKNLGC